MKRNRALVIAIALALQSPLGACGDDDGAQPDATLTHDGMVSDGAAADAAVDAGPQYVGCSAAGEGTFAPTEEDVTFVASADGLTLHGTLWVPEAGGSFAVVVLLHQYCTSRTDWTQTTALAAELAKRGFLVLAYDARGFGLSTDGGSMDYCGEGNPTLFAPMVTDLGDAIDYLDTRPEANLDCLGIGGGSMGSSVALIYGASDPRVQTVVMLSPGLAYLGLMTSPAMTDWNPRPALMIAAEGDPDAVTDMNALANLGDNVTAEEVTGNGHGAAILSQHADRYEQVMVWFSDLL